MTRESNVTYLIVAASPFLFVFSITALWLLWKRATAPKWNGMASLDATTTTGLELDCSSDKVSSNAILSKTSAVVSPDMVDEARFKAS